MDKLKNMLNPGSKADDETMYKTGDNTGKVAGQGSHFGSGSATAPDNASTVAVKDGVAGDSAPISGSGSTSNSSAVRAAQLATGTSGQSSNTPIYSEFTSGKDSTSAATAATSGNPYSSHGVDSRVDGGNASRSTATSGGIASAAATTAYGADKSNRSGHEDVATVPSTSTSQPSTSTTVPTAVHTSQQSNIGTAVTTGSAPTSSSASTSVPRPDTTSAAHTSNVDTTPGATTQGSSHLGRDAAIGGGLGAAAGGLAASTTGDHHSRSGADIPVSTSTTTPSTSGIGSTNVGPSTTGTHPTSSGADIPVSSSSGLGSTAGTSSIGATGLGSSTGTSTTPATGLGSSTGTSSTTAGGGGPLGSLRALIDAKTGSSAATDSPGSKETGPYTESKNSVPSELPLGTVRPLVDEKTGSNAADQSSASREVPAGSTTTGSTTTGSSGSFLGRDAAVGAGAGALGAAGVRSLVDEKTGSNTATQSSGSQPLGSSTAGSSSGIGSSTLAPSTTGSHPTTSGADMPVSSTTGSSGLGSSATGPSSSALGSSSTGPSNTLASSTTGSHPTSSGADIPVSSSSTTAPSGTTSSNSHLGRDAAIGAGAGAGAGAGIGGLRSLINEKTESSSATSGLGSSSTSGPTSTGLGSSGTTGLGSTSTSGPTSTGLGSTSTSVPASSGLSSSGTTGLGSTGTAGPSSTGFGSSGTTGLGSTTSNAPGATSSSTTQPSTFQSSAPVQPVAHDTTRSTDTTSAGGHHTARDTALGAGAGAGLIGTYDYLKNKDNGESGALSSTSGPAHIERTPDEFPVTTSTSSTTPQPSSTLGGSSTSHQSSAIPSSTTAAGTTTSGQPSTFQSSAPVQPVAHDQTRDSHLGRDAAVGAGVVGAGAAGYAAHEHHDSVRDRATGLAESRGEGRLSSVSGPTTGSTTTQPTLAEDPTTRSRATELAESRGEGRLSSHPTSTAGLGAGTAGVAAYTAAEEGHHHDTEVDEHGNKKKGGLLGIFKRDKTHDDETTSSTTHDKERKGSGVLGMFKKDKHDDEDVRDTTHHGHGREAAGAAGVAGAGAVGAHEYEKHHDPSTTATSSTIDPARTNPSNDFAEGASETRGLAHRPAEGVTSTTGTTGNLGTTHGIYNEHYSHPKTESDIAAEHRNDIPVVGELHREGRFHGKEGGAPGATGVAPEERDQAYIESQKHLPILHGSGKVAEGHDGHNRLHKDPPAGHPAAAGSSAAGPAGIEGSGSGLLHGHHSDRLKDTEDINVENARHDPVGMGYDGHTHLDGRDGSTTARGL